MASQEHGMWGALAKGGSSEPSGADSASDDFDSPVVQRTVPAASAPPVVPRGAIVSPFSHPYRPSSGSLDTSDDQPAAEDSRAPRETEENPMATRKTKRATHTRPAKGTSAQFQICALLLANGDTAREELQQQVTADVKAFHSGTFLAKKAGRVEINEKTGKLHLTAAGKEWVSGGANLDAQKHASRTSPAKVNLGRHRRTTRAKNLPKAERTRLGVVDKGQVLDAGTRRATSPRTFRCAVISDGGFFVEKNGQRVDLEPDEHRDMLRYLERMAIEQET